VDAIAPAVPQMLVDGGGVGVMGSGSFPLSTSQEIGPDLGFLFSAVVILRMRVFYKCMAIGAHYPEGCSHPRSGRERRGRPGLGLGSVRVEI
jgi:hypothetical protein